MLRKIATAKDRLTAFYINFVFLALLTYLIAYILRLAFLAFFFMVTVFLMLYI